MVLQKRKRKRNHQPYVFQQLVELEFILMETALQWGAVAGVLRVVTHPSTLSSIATAISALSVSPTPALPPLRPSWQRPCSSPLPRIPSLSNTWPLFSSTPAPRSLLHILPFLLCPSVVLRPLLEVAPWLCQLSSTAPLLR